MKQFTADELGVLIELVRKYARECESHYYEAANEDTPGRAMALKRRWEAVDLVYERTFEMFEANFGMPAALVEDMRFEDVFEKRMIESSANVSSS